MNITPMVAENKSKKITDKYVTIQDKIMTKVITNLETEISNVIAKKAISDLETENSNGTTKKDFLKNQKKSFSEENLKNKKEYKNTGLELESVANENEVSLQNSIQNLKISVNSNDVVSKELLEHKNVKWSDLKLTSKSIKVLTSLGYNFPSPVQFQAIPEILAGSDLLVRAKNGSGKTLSFLIPIIEKINVDENSLQAIIVAPTRELALQIARFARSLCKDLNIKSAPLIGGSNIKDDIMRVSAGVHLLIGSPGRLHSILSKNLCKIDNNPLIIFDEADKLLDSVLFEEMYNFLRLIPKTKQLCLFSATFPNCTKSFINTNLNNPKLIKVTDDYALANLSQFYCVVESNTKLPCLKSLLTYLDIDQCIIYVNSINNCQILAEKITEMGLSCYFIHSKLTQDERNQIFHNFSKNKTKILVSTDITTRGTDVQGVNVVINFELPFSSESYLHRIGRAGRFGRKACCINIIRNEEIDIINSFASFVGAEISPCSGPKLKEFCKK